MRSSNSPAASSRLPLTQPVLAAFLCFASVGLTAGLSSCALEPDAVNRTASQPKTSQASDPTAPQAPKTQLKIVTTTLPVTNFTKAVVGDRAEVSYLMPPNVGPHDFQAKPEDVQRIAQADVLVENGLGLEEYLEGLIQNAGNSKLNVLDSSKEVQPIANEAEAHEAEAHSHAADEHAHGEYNPHIWLDPSRAIDQVETIRDGLIAIDPQGKETYTANAAAYIEKLKALDAEIADRLKPYAGKAFVTYHDFAAYFAQRYGLKTEFLVGVPEENPAPADVKRVMDTVKASELKTLLTEPQAAGNPFDSLAKDLQVNISSFDPMETGAATSLEPDYYLAVMRQNAKNLEAAFRGQTTQSSLPWMRQGVLASANRAPIGQVN